MRCQILIVVLRATGFASAHVVVLKNVALAEPVAPLVLSMTERYRVRALNRSRISSSISSVLSTVSAISRRRRSANFLRRRWTACLTASSVVSSSSAAWA